MGNKEDLIEELNKKLGKVSFNFGFFECLQLGRDADLYMPTIDDKEVDEIKLAKFLTSGKLNQYAIDLSKINNTQRNALIRVLASKFSGNMNEMEFRDWLNQIAKEK